MADVFDNASDREASNLEASLNATLGKSKQLEVQPTGKCNYCTEPIEAQATNPRFCDASCRDSFDKLLNRKF